MGRSSKQKICIAMVVIEILVMFFLIYQTSYGELYGESFGADGRDVSSGKIANCIGEWIL